jgi:hypothetical protein
MAIVKSFAIAAALLAAATSMAIAQNGPAPSASPGAAKQNCAGIRQGLTECSPAQVAAPGETSSSTGQVAAPGESSKGTPLNPAFQATRMHGSDTVILSDSQRKMAWNELSQQATNQNAPGFEAATGTFVPDTVKIEPVPDDVANDVLPLQPYSFAMVDHSLLIVDPTNKVIAAVVTKPSNSD